MIKNYVLPFIFLCCFHAGLLAQCLPCGTGANGAFNPTADTILAGGTYNFSSFIINAGITVTDTGILPVIIHCTGNVIINGTLNANGPNGADGIDFAQAGLGGKGVAGGSDGGDGVYSVNVGMISGNNGQGLGAGFGGNTWSGGGGAGYSAAGQDAGPGYGLGGPAYGNVQIVVLNGGSGGGGGAGGFNCGSGGGGAGGGVIQIASCDTLKIGASGFIMANGGAGGSDGNGNCGGGGGGSGGTIWLSANSIVNNGQIQATPGIGGQSTNVGAPYYGVGGTGANGRVRFDYTSLSGTGTVVPASAYSGTISVTLSDSNAHCHGAANGSAVVTPTSGQSPYTYAWSNGTTDSLATGLVAGTYTVTVTDSTGCRSIDTVVIGQPSAIVLTMSHTNKTTPANNGTASVAATGGAGNYTYSWSPTGGTTATITGLGAGLYSVTVTDAHGCTSTDTVRVYNTVSVPEQNTFSACIVYPNPANDVLNMEMTLKQAGDIDIILMDYTGRVLEAHTYKSNGGKGIFTIALRQYANGNYFVKVRTGDSIQNFPVSILR